ncbi:DUF4440 domain-containing protein [Kutzneria buriramensis]|uniref:DUF4440 domain-containing protein n=1 Tax=Kutzneria buriramensis TaxID=1045776 RepID=A0A3E0HHL6_9PSEU|nr:DUF4440 domain-containing protein [Kutzneria buriramensis]REH45872.1 hypothetical protein BCF44_1074 [Kutzneria buriramensis]
MYDVVAAHHHLLAQWLGSSAPATVLADLRAAHTADFTLVTARGSVLDRDELLAALEASAGARPGLRIDVSDVVVVARMDDFVLVRFTETHVAHEERAVRLTTALLHAVGSAWRWAYVHETAVREPA